MSLALSRTLLDRFFPDDGVAVELVDGLILRERGRKQEYDAKDGAAGHEEQEDRDGAVRWHCRERPGRRALATQLRSGSTAATSQCAAGSGPDATRRDEADRQT
ncbi:17.8 kDa heat shock protein-like [Phragmites australis]|uniref:17.8 kDa heat shock protein-like n=1 Tax=Phragmites australis TaxID=29695 RepID=UPI002D79A7A7|nr:17.8 kDa heat shock protein-like [Phragmites australis]